MVLAIAVPTLIGWAFEPFIHERGPYVIYVPAVMGVALFLGWRPAAVVTLGAVIAANLLFHPVQTFGFGEGLIRTLLFCAAGMVSIVLAHIVRRTVIELDETARREEFLASELGHRAKNQLALVEALARQSQQSGETPDQFFDKLLPRLQTLSRAQDLLTRSGYGASGLQELVEDALRPFAHHPGISIAGAKVAIPPAQTTPLIMAVHELGTNASKYGALTVPEGRVEVRWRVEADRVALCWTERNGPPVDPPRRRGLGSRLISRHPAFQEVSLEFPPEGARCTIVLGIARGGVGHRREI
ncbi:MAG: HWE histidine kinase domain-containing protein [Sphingomonas bacterium]